ncbi:hypothetical protein DSO57_1030063 [Entomophthora muscae]|uniref:Uncharacterized protein n=1 Tax=Entomophthora muscae TaxID=34485 RepID=A0ACC2RFQ8_9FUNG|nr:hypothetical protein DSO57_1030063 [Entomophthora muscae]
MSFESAVSSGYFCPLQHKSHTWEGYPSGRNSAPNSPPFYNYPPMNHQRRDSLVSDYNPTFNTLNPIIASLSYGDPLPTITQETCQTSRSTPEELPKEPVKKRVRQEISTKVSSDDFPASREPDLICDEAHEKCSARTNNLALGMLKILNHYNTTMDSPKQSAFPSLAYETLLGGGSGDGQSGDQSLGSMDKIRFDLITTLRNTLPLPHLQKIAKNNNLASIQWYPCNFPGCFHVYQTRRSLRRHIFVHTGETPHECQFPGCKKAYTAADRLSEHMHTHTNQRPYKCTVEGCTKAYNDAKTLREHKLTHGEKNFVCPVPSCGKNFHRKTHLKQHMRTHVNDFVNEKLVV